jgi:hypothetical protein
VHRPLPVEAKDIFNYHIYIVSSIQILFIAIKITYIAPTVAKITCINGEMGIEPNPSIVKSLACNCRVPLP